MERKLKTKIGIEALEVNQEIVIDRPTRKISPMLVYYHKHYPMRYKCVTINDASCKIIRDHFTDADITFDMPTGEIDLITFDTPFPNWIDQNLQDVITKAVRDRYDISPADYDPTSEPNPDEYHDFINNK